MARPKTSILRRTLLQTDCGFWCIHDHLDVLAFWACQRWRWCSSSALGLVGVWRAFELPWWVSVLGARSSFRLGLCISTALPLPCAVFAWKTADGEAATAGECFAFCRRRGGRLFWILFRMRSCGSGRCCFWACRSCGSCPRRAWRSLVGLFEDTRKVFRRSGRILREDSGVGLMGFLYLAMGLVMGGLVVLPRLLLGTSILGANCWTSAGGRRWLNGCGYSRRCRSVYC